MTLETIMCDNCDIPATVNYQNDTVRYDIVDNNLVNMRRVGDLGGMNEHYCDEHDPKYID